MDDDRIEQLLAGLRDSMLTRSDLDEVLGSLDVVRDNLGRLSGLLEEVASIRLRLDQIEDAMGGMAGFTRQLDELKARLRDVEHHLGVARKII